MTICTNNWEEEIVAMKAMLEKLVKENEKEEACIKLQEEKIATLTKELEKRSASPPQRTQTARMRRRRPSKVNLLTKRYTQRRAANSRTMGLLLNNGRTNSKLGCKNAVKAQLGGDVRKTHFYTKPYAKRVGTLCMPCG